MKKKGIYNSIPRNGLVLEILGDGSAVDTNDSTKRNGTATNITYSNSSIGYQKQASTFNGTSAYISSAAAPTITGNFSISLWMKRNGASAANSTIFEIGTYSTTGFGIWSYDGVGSGGTILPNQISWRIGSNYNNYAAMNVVVPADSLWHHIVVTYDGSNVYTYLDNVLKSQIANTTNPASASTYIAGKRQDSATYYKGDLEAIRVYNRALSSGEITNLYYEGLRKLGGGSDDLLSGLVNYWDFLKDGNDIIGGKNLTTTGTVDFTITDNFGINKGAGTLTEGGANGLYTADTAILTNVGTIIGFCRNTNASLEDTNGDIVLSKTVIGVSDHLVFRNFGTKVRYIIQDDIKDYTVTPNTTDYYSFALAWDTSTAWKGYRDGIAVVTGSAVKNPAVATAGLGLNQAMNNTAPWSTLTYNAKNNYHSLMVFNRRLSDDEIAKIDSMMRIKYLYPFNKTLPSGLGNKCQYWVTMDNNGSTTYYDATKTRGNLTATSDTKVRRGRSKAISCNGTSTYLDTGVVSLIPSTYTVSCWVNFAGTPTSGNIYAFLGSYWTTNPYGGFEFRLTNNTGTLQLGLFTKGSSSPTDYSLTVNYTPTTGKWYHLVVSKTNTVNDGKMYLNGTLMTTTATGGTNALNLTTSNINIGAILVNGVRGRFMNGLMKDVMIFDSVLTQTEIQQLYYSQYTN